MLEILSTNPILTFFLVVAAGAALGQIKFGPLRFGAVGALFVGLALSAFHPELGDGMAVLQSLGLALFVYAVGISAGSTFLSQLRQQAGLMGAGALAAMLGAVIAIIGAWLLGIPANLAAGAYTGALTSTPALDAALRIAGSSDPGAGYAVAYPFGVVAGIIVASIIVTRPWEGANDTASLAGVGLVARTAAVTRTVNVRRVDAWRRQDVRISYLRRGDVTRVVVPGEDLMVGDEVVIVGAPDAVERAISEVGEELDHHLADDRRDVDFERFTISNPVIMGKTIAELNLPVKFGGVITRVRRGDLELLATDELVLQPGDHVAVAVPSEEVEELARFLGNSEQKVSEVDALALGVGLVLGMVLGLVILPLPGGAIFSLGIAGGPLIAGMVLGALRRTGPLVWSMPDAANRIIRQLGLLFFLAALGLGAGSAFKAVVATSLGWKVALVATVIAALCAVTVAVVGKLLNLSGPRVAGAIAGFIGQPAILSATQARVADERIESSYAALFATCIVFKILLVPLIYSLL